MNCKASNEQVGIDRLNSFIPDSLNGFVYRPADFKTESDDILNCRWKGYRRFGYEGPKNVEDEFDDRAAHFVCADPVSGKIIGCLRLLVKPRDAFELEQWVDISDWLAEGVHPAELTRFSIPLSKHSATIKFGLWKLAWLYARHNSVTHFIIATKEDTKPSYDFMCFLPYPGKNAVFDHPRISNLPHRVMILDIIGAADVYRTTRPALHRFFCEMQHPEIRCGIRSGIGE